MKKEQQQKSASFERCKYKNESYIGVTILFLSFSQFFDILNNYDTATSYTNAAV